MGFAEIYMIGIMVAFVILLLWGSVYHRPGKPLLGLVCGSFMMALVWPATLAAVIYYAWDEFDG